MMSAWAYSELLKGISNLNKLDFNASMRNQKNLEMQRPRRPEA